MLVAGHRRKTSPAGWLSALTTSPAGGTVAAALVSSVVAAALLLSATALAAGPTINEAGKPAFPERAYTLHVPSKVALGPGDVSVRENGEVVQGLAIESADQAAEGEFATVLVIDASTSMAGRPIAEAVRAAQAFADRRAPGQELAIVTFNSRTETVLPFTADEDEIAEALSSQPNLGPATHVHDAVATAVRTLDDAGISAGSVVVLSDGADNGSAASVGDVSTLATDAGVRVFAVGLRSKRFDPSALEDLAVGGAFADAANPGELAPIFERFGETLASEYLVSYQSEGSPGEALTVEVEVAGVPGIARDRYVIPATSAPAPERAEEGGFWSAGWTMVAVIGIAAGLLGLSLFVLVSPRRETAPERMARFIDLRRSSMEGDTPRRSDEEESRGPAGYLERAFDGREWWERFKEELDVARIEIRPVYIVAATALGAMLLMLLVGSIAGSMVLSPIGLLVIPAVRMVIARKLRHQQQEFAEQLADNLQIIASAMRAGQSMVGAITVVVEEAPEPTRAEFRRIVSDERVGVPLEDAIRKVASRMANRDLEQVALVATIQRDTGGNTAEVLDRVMETVRERGRLRRLMETLTAQGRLSQIVVSALPFLLIGAVTLINKDYMKPLFETGTGQFLLMLGIGLSLLGSLIIKRIVELRE